MKQLISKIIDIEARDTGDQIEIYIYTITPKQLDDAINIFVYSLRGNGHSIDVSLRPASEYFSESYIGEIRIFI